MVQKNILLPTDFSNNSWSAIVYALKLYANESCTFYLLNSSAVKISMMSNLSNKLMETLQKETREELLDLKKQMKLSNINENHNYKILISTQTLFLH